MHSPMASLSAVSTRPAGRNDLPALLDLYHQLNPADPAADPARATTIYDDMLSRPGFTIFVAEAVGRVVATCTLAVIPNLTRGGRSYALIENVVTDAAHRGRGFGRAVLQAAITAAWAQDCYKAMLMTGSRKESTLRFYDNSGFTRDKTAFTIRQP